MPTTSVAARTRRALAAGVVLSTAIGLASCAGAAPAAAPSGGSASSAPAAEAGSALDLSDVCPATVVMQQDWQPEAEHGAMYNLVGDDYTVDTDTKTVTGSLVAQGVDTGVDIEVRPGGPNVNFQPVPALMYLDPDILLGAVTTDAAIVAAADQPTVAVASQLTWSPQILMWDPESHDGAQTIEEATADGAIVVTAGDVIPSLLRSQGMIDDSQIDTSYEGTPQRFVSDPTILQQGFATAEPYIYENEIPEWGKPVGYQLLSEIGWSVYPEPLAVRPEAIEEHGDCLEKLIPIMQQSQLDFLEEPDKAIALILDLVEQYDTGWTYSEGVAEYSVQQQLDLGLVEDDPASGVFGAFDPERMQTIVDDFVPFLVDAGSISQADADAIDVESLYTNDFLDTSISME
ncbi:substrate-binding domain-containing protein [Microbacterium lacusdiani]